MAGRWIAGGLLLVALALIAEPAHAARHLPVHPERHAAAKKAPATAPTQPAPEAVPVPVVNAAPLAPPPPAELTVAAVVAPPFVTQRPDGTWSGLSVGLWKAVADDLHLPFRLVPADAGTALGGVADGRFDVAIGALGITPERAERVAFTHPFFTTGLAIAVPTRVEGMWAWWRAVARPFAPGPLAVVALSSLALLLAASGALVWLLERKRNPRFAGPWYRGVGKGVWWSIAPASVIGGNDSGSVGRGGRLVRLLWMVIGLAVVVGLTAATTASLTVGAGRDDAGGYADLHRVRVGVVRDTPAAAALRDRGFVARGYAGVAQGLAAVAAGEIDAFVDDAPALLYAAARDYPRKIRVLPDRFIRQDYGFALRGDNPLRAKIDADLLARIGSQPWRDAVTRYLGAAEAAMALP